MKSHEVVAVMRYKKFLQEEPIDSNERIASAVRYLMIKHRTSPEELAKVLGSASTHYVQYRKLKQAHFRVSDLDKMSEFWGVHPAEFVYGYKALAEADAEEEKEEDYG